MRPWLAIAALLILIRLPFLDQPIQGDDVYYLAGAQHAQIDPLHPSHARYVFVGQTVDMRGHPHPPLNAWYLAAVLALLGDIREVPFHLSYLPFSLLAAWSVWRLCRRFATRPLAAALLALATPAFVINGNSLESDLPFFAFWLAGFALFVEAVDARSALRLSGSALALTLAAMTAYQAVAAPPLLALYLWPRRRDWRAAWAALLTPIAAIAAYQLWERLTSGALPATVLAGYFQSYGLQTLANKARNAVALTVHLSWLVFPALTLAALLRRRQLARDERFLAAWAGGFFAFALVIFFAGSMRYLLPVAVPVAILVANRLDHRPRWLAAGFGAQLLLSLALAWANYDHWDGYRRFVASMKSQLKDRRMWVNGEWGLRFYAEAEGGLPLRQGQAVRPGDAVLSSRLSFPVEFTTGGGTLVPVAQTEIRPRLPLQLIGIHARSAYSSAARGFLPFDITTSPVDIVTAETAVERRPTLSHLPMGDPAAAEHIVSGLYQLESGAWRWSAARATVLLKPPPEPRPVTAEFRIWDQAPGRRVTLLLNGAPVAAQTFPGPGAYRLESAAGRVEGDTAVVALEVDRTFQVSGDQRQLGLIVVAIGFR